MSGQIKASEDHKTRSKLLHSPLYLGWHTTSFLLHVLRFFFLSCVERKQTAARHTREKFPSLLFCARKFKLNFLKLHLNRAYFWTFWKKLKLRKTQNSSQILKKLRAYLQKTQNLPTPLECKCQKVNFFKTLENLVCFEVKIKGTVYIAKI